MLFKLPRTISETIFRTNDIRGNVQKDLTPNVVYAIGLAFGSEALENNQQQLIIARDGRLSSPTLRQALAQGIMESGCDVIDIGAVPTPLLYFATHTFDASSGIMVTGSHNPPEDNGLKLLLRRKVLSKKQIQSIFTRLQMKHFSHGNGHMKTLNIISMYYSYLLNDIKLKRKLRIVVDCGNSIVGTVFPELARKLGCEVIELFCNVDGNFPNHFPDPTIPKNLEDLIQTVKEKHADIGIAFDGDGDRLGIITNQGKIIWPDRALMLFAKDLLKQNPGTTIIYDVKCTRLLEKWIKEHNGKPLMWKTGHSLIKAKLHETNAKLAGEMSGHFYFNDRWFGFDDALYAAARLLEILSEDATTADQIFSLLPDSINTPELRVSIADEEKSRFIDEFKQLATFKDGKIILLDGVRVDFDFGFGLVRASNTTPCLILRFEADNETNLKYIQKMFRQQLLAISPKLQLPF